MAATRTMENSKRLDMGKNYTFFKCVTKTTLWEPPQRIFKSPKNLTDDMQRDRFPLPVSILFLMRHKYCRTKLSGLFCFRQRQTRRETGTQSYGSVHTHHLHHCRVSDRQTTEGFLLWQSLVSVCKEVQIT